jgi:hypothetical protein
MNIIGHMPSFLEKLVQFIVLLAFEWLRPAQLIA